MDEQRLWIAQCLADIFSDVDARPELPITAWHILEEGLSQEAVESLWYDHLRPALADGVEGHGPIDVSWLAERMTEAAPRNVMARWWKRVSVPADPEERQFQAMLRCHELLGRFSRDDWPAAARVMHDMVEIFLGVPGGRQGVQSEHFQAGQVERLSRCIDTAYGPMLASAKQQREGRDRLKAAVDRVIFQA